MNTISLQKLFLEVYTNFFARNDLVLSGEYSFPWGRDSGINSKNYLKIKTTIPLKCYIGIKFTNELNVYFKDIIFFNTNKKIFESVSYNKVIKEDIKLINLLKKELIKIGINKGIEIEILSETARGHGFGFSGTTSAIISFGIYKIYDYFVSKTKKDNELFYKDYFNQIFALSGKMDYISRYGDTYGHNAIFTLKSNKGISSFFTEIIDFSNGDIDKIDDLYYNYQEISLSDNLELLFDFYIVFTGIPTDTKQVESFKKSEFEDDNLGNFVLDNISNLEKNFYLNKFVDQNLINNTKLDIISLQNIKILELFYKLNLKAYDENLIELFISQINNLRYAFNLIEKQSNFVDDFNYYFRNNKSNTKEMLGIFPSYSGKLGGSYIIITKTGLSRKTIENTIDELKKSYPNIEVEYCSYLDGISGDGVILEQFISVGIYSKYIDKNKMNYKDNKGNTYLGDYSQLIENQKEGLLLDTVNNKIYLNGEKLTSKDIPSQNITIEIIIKLLENIGVEVSNKEFSISSYTTNKNEMIGKIISPLTKLIEEKTSIKLPLVCKGGLKDFYVKMGEVNLKIGIIKPL